MSFQLVYGDREFWLPLHFESHIEERLVQVMERGQAAPDGTDPTCAGLSNRIVEAITALIENNVLPPTDKQIKYAVAIARELSLQLPAEVLQFRDSMTVFLGTHAEKFRRIRAQQHTNP